MRKIVLTEGSLTSSNKGINAITKGAITSIINNAVNKKELTISLFSLKKRNEILSHRIYIDGGEYCIDEERVRYNYIFLFALLGLIMSCLSHKKNKELFRRFNKMRYLTGADIVIDISQGDSFTDMYGVKHFFHMALNKYIALCCGIPYIFFPQTIGPFGNVFTRWIAGYLLQNAKLVYVRENKSCEYINRTFKNSKINLVEAADMAFLLEPQETDCPALEKFIDNADEVVGFNISGFLMNNNYAEIILGSNVNYRSIIKNILSYFLEECNGSIVLVPHVDEDFIVSEKIYHEFLDKYPDRLFLLTPNFNESQLKYLISKFDFFIGSRMHACIAAISSFVPTIPIGYSYKFSGIMRSIGLEDCVIDLRKDSNMALERVREIYNSRKIIKDRLLANIPRLKKTALECGKAVF